MRQWVRWSRTQKIIKLMCVCVCAHERTCVKLSQDISFLKKFKKWLKRRLSG